MGWWSRCSCQAGVCVQIVFSLGRGYKSMWLTGRLAGEWSLRGTVSRYSAELLPAVPSETPSHPPRGMQWAPKLTSKSQTLWQGSPASLKGPGSRAVKTMTGCGIPVPRRPRGELRTTVTQIRSSVTVITFCFPLPAFT